VAGEDEQPHVVQQRREEDHIGIVLGALGGQVTRQDLGAGCRGQAVGPESLGDPTAGQGIVQRDQKGQAADPDHPQAQERVVDGRRRSAAGVGGSIGGLDDPPGDDRVLADDLLDFNELDVVTPEGGAELRQHRRG
jgi:hypothetical protein